MPDAIAAPAIKLFSTYTKDVLVNASETVLAEQDGGPAYFLSKALSDSNVPFDCISGDPLTVEILITPDEERGRVPRPPVKKQLPTDLGEWAIVSTVLDEWDLPGTKCWV